MEYTLVDIAFILKNEEKFLKENLEHLDFLHSWTYNPQKRLYNCKCNKFKFFLPNFNYIESGAFFEHN